MTAVFADPFFENDQRFFRELLGKYRHVAVAYGSTPGIGGLGHSVAEAISTICQAGPKVTAYGPGPTGGGAVPDKESRVSWRRAPKTDASEFAKRTWLRRRQGRTVWICDSRLAAWISKKALKDQPDLVYGFTQVSAQLFRAAIAAGLEAVLENPNGHIRDFATVYREQARLRSNSTYTGHPCQRMMEQVEEEYRLATWIRVYSRPAKQSMVRNGVPAEKIWVVPHPININHFVPGAPLQTIRALRLCFVGSLCLRKGFYFLLRAMQRFPSGQLQLRIVGATGDRDSASLFKTEAAGLDVSAVPGDPLPAYQQADLFVLPTLEDGFGFVVAEAMACGLPVIVTSACGASDWVRHGETGWIIPAANEEALADAIEVAYKNRDQLRAMGQLARQDVAAHVALLGQVYSPANA